jgi:iron(III) transport system permease protein
VPGIILGIGYIVAFIQAPWWALILVYVALAFYLGFTSSKSTANRLIVIVGGTIIGYLLTRLPGEPDTGAVLGYIAWRYILTAILLTAAGFVWWGTDTGKRKLVTIPFLGMAGYVLIYNLAGPQIRTLFIWSRTLPGMQWPKVVSSLSDQLGVLLQPPHALLGLTLMTIVIFMMAQVGRKAKVPVALLVLSVAAALSFEGEPLALIGTSYIIIFAYAVRSLPASVRAGVAALQQIDPSLEEASANMGADAQLTFRKITLPLILPAFIAGLIFSFARHMTSLSTIIFLVTGKWRILALEIFDSVERRGLSVAAAYSVVLIAIVLVGIGLTYLILGRTLGSSGERVEFLGE